MTKFSNHLRNAGASRQRFIAGGTLALAVAGTALGFGLTGSGTASASAYSVARSGNGPVVVHIGQNQSIVNANQELAAMGIKETIGLRMASGPAPVKGPVTCTQGPGAPAVSGPKVAVLVGKDGTEVIAPGTTGKNTGVGTWHVDACYVYPAGWAGNSGAS